MNSIFLPEDKRERPLYQEQIKDQIMTIYRFRQPFHRTPKLSPILGFPLSPSTDRETAPDITPIQIIQQILAYTPASPLPGNFLAYEGRHTGGQDQVMESVLVASDDDSIRLSCGLRTRNNSINSEGSCTKAWSMTEMLRACSQEEASGGALGSTDVFVDSLTLGGSFAMKAGVERVPKARSHVEDGSETESLDVEHWVTTPIQDVTIHPGRVGRSSAYLEEPLQVERMGNLLRP